MFYGLFHLSTWAYTLLTLGLTHLSVVCTTIYLHRYQTHRALELHPVVSHFCRFWLWFATATVTKEWVAVHRKHHANVEIQGDPHSPQLFGIARVFFGGLGLYRHAAHDPEVLEQYGHGTPDDWLERHLYTPRQEAGILSLLLLQVVLFGWIGLIIWAIQMLWIPLFAAGVINGIGHYWGYRNYETKDASRNVVPWGIFAGGEELHNNHHAYSSSAKLSSKWWEFDIGWLYIKVLSALNLVHVKRLAPNLNLLPNKIIDAEKIKALINSRLQVMARYRSEVILPVLKTEQKQASEASKRLFHRAKALLSREESILNINAKDRLMKLLEQCSTLKLVYHNRLQLQNLWEKTYSTQKEFLLALQQWCQQAEETGIEALHQFAKRLREFVGVGTNTEVSV